MTPTPKNKMLFIFKIQVINYNIKRFSCKVKKITKPHMILRVIYPNLKWKQIKEFNRGLNGLSLD